MGAIMPAVRLDRVCKRFGNHLAVDDLTLEVPVGSVYGFIGPNGSGKTTTLRMILHILLPDSGRIEVLGDSRTAIVRDKIGYLPEERGLYKKMTVRRLLRYYGELKGASRRQVDNTIDRWIDQIELRPWLDAKVEALSKGMSQKVQFIAAVVSRPPLVILDEPFSGLDPVNQNLLEEEIRRVSTNGATVIFSTHVMQHAERLCEKLLLLAKGRRKFEGTLDEARAQLPARLSVVARQSLAPVDGVEGCEPVGTAADGWQEWDVRLKPGGNPSDLLQACTERAIPLRRFDERRASLHDVFLQLVGPAEARP